jgi:hypothetical protein
MLKQKYFLADIFILSAEKQPIKLSWRKIECLQNNQRITAGYAVNAIHKVVGINDTRTDYQGYDYPPPGQGEQSPLIKHQSHGREMKKQSCHLSGGFYIVHEADERHQCQGKQEPGIFKATRQEIGQRSEIENNPTTA